MTDHTLTVEPLTAAAFASFGTVVEAPHTGGRAANEGTALRFDDIAPLVLTAAGGRPLLSWMRVTPVELPFSCRRLERHPRSSQLFMPVGSRRFLVVVSIGDKTPEMTKLRAFQTNGSQGVNFGPGTWHHAALALDTETDFLVLGHASNGSDCDICDLAQTYVVGRPG